VSDCSPKVPMGEQLSLSVQLPAEQGIDVEVDDAKDSDSGVEWLDTEWQGCTTGGGGVE
jgi:hypothetical protein